MVASRSGDELWISARGDGTVKRIDLDLDPPAITASVLVGVQPESMMLTPNERTLVLSMRGSPASLGFVDTKSADIVTPFVQVIPIAGAGTFGDLAVMTPNGRYVFATFDRGLPPNKGGIAVVDVQTRQVVNWWEYPARAARTGSGIRRRLRAFSFLFPGGLRPPHPLHARSRGPRPPRSPRVADSLPLVSSPGDSSLAGPPYTLARGDPAAPLPSRGSLAIARFFSGGLRPPDPLTRSLAGTPPPRSARAWLTRYRSFATCDDRGE